MCLIFPLQNCGHYNFYQTIFTVHMPPGIALEKGNGLNLEGMHEGLNKLSCHRECNLMPKTRQDAHHGRRQEVEEPDGLHLDGTGRLVERIWR
jgi:hypothetical protein